MASDKHKRPVTERRVFNLTNCEVRSAEGDGPAVFSGYAAKFNELSVNLGGFRERIQPGAFRDAIEEGDDVRFLINHDQNLILGRTPRTLSLSEDEIGLRVECELPDTSYAKDLIVSMQRGDITQMSFGFQTTGDEWNEKDPDSGLPIRELTGARLFDVSAVAYPAYPDTTAEIRSLIAEETPELLDRAARAAEELADAPEADAEERATWTTSYINDLPDSAFLYIEDGGEKDAEGKTKPRSKRHFPYKDASGKVDLPHLRDALGRIPQSNLPDDVKASVEAKAKKILAANGGEKNSLDLDGDLTPEELELRRDGGARVVPDHQDCVDGWAVVWNWNDELYACCSSEEAATSTMKALAAGNHGGSLNSDPAVDEELREKSEVPSIIAAGALLDDMLHDERAGKVLSKDNAAKLSKAHALLQAVLSTAGDAVPGLDDMGGAASTEIDETIQHDHKPEGEKRDGIEIVDVVGPGDVAAFLETMTRDAWGFDEDYELWIITQMLQLASCFMLNEGGEGDMDGGSDAADDAQESSAMLAIFGALKDMLPGSPGEQNSVDEETEQRSDLMRRLRLRELEMTL